MAIYLVEISENESICGCCETHIIDASRKPTDSQVRHLLANQSYALSLGVEDIKIKITKKNVIIAKTEPRLSSIRLKI